jgi:tripartite-type tricarboxylate transporter receptor subunit TctC
VISPSLYRQMPYDALKDFTPVMKLAEGPYVLVVHPSLPARSVRELVELARANPGKIDYASSGNGSSQHLVGALFGQMAGVTLSHVPYKGSGQATQDLVGGQVKVSFVGAPNAVPYLANGKLRALGVTTKKRSADLPDIPTIDEAGVAGYDATLWLGLLAPLGTPADVVARIREGVSKAFSTAEARKLVNSAGVDVALSTPEEFASLMRSELERWGTVVRETKATIN